MDQGKTWVEDRRWTWVLLILMVWPQWRAANLLYRNVIQGEEEALEKKKEFERRVGGLEPFLESSPQVCLQICYTWLIFYFQMIIKAAIMGQLIGIDWTTEQDAVVPQLGKQTIGFSISFFKWSIYYFAYFSMVVFVFSILYKTPSFELHIRK